MHKSKLGGGFEDIKYSVVSLDKQHDNDIINAFNLNYKHYDPFNHEKRLSDPLPTATIDGNTLPKIDYQCNSIVLEHLDILSKQDMLLGIIQKNSKENFAENDVYYYHGDHLGSANWITETNGKPIQYIHYAPYGELIDNQQTINYDERYKFTGKERDAESGYDYFGARYYASPFSFWLSVDPLADKYPAISPYAYCTWNPVKFVDPDGRWIAVTANDELGVSYTIVGGNVDLRDRNVYVVGDGYNQRDGKPTNATILTQTATPFSFSDEKTNKIVIGSIINMKDKSGDVFISQFQRNEITLTQYIFDNPQKEGNKSGRNGGNCDFKHKFDHNYGMPISLLNGKIASARDIGNFAAGYLAARNGIPKILTMFAFDMYNNYQNNTIKGEPLVSKQAQRLGYNYGLKDLFFKYINLFTNK